jgi:GNAT superfamily N-acetyltransferase/RimJ/RimL family protein N-acetyltransferase
MRIVDLERTDDDGVRACHETVLAASAADDPIDKPWSLGSFTGWLRVGWDGNPSEAWYVPGPGGEGDGGDRGDEGDEVGSAVAGWYRLELPDLENKDRARLKLVVHPAARRRGLGRELLRHAAARAAEHGRSLLSSTALRGTAGEEFAKATGFTFSIYQPRRMLDLRTVPAGQFARLRAEAAPRAAGYTLIRWTGPTPEEHLAHHAGVLNAMNDAPHGAGYEDNLWDADRVRERAEASLAVSGERAYSVGALHDGSGEMAALTQVFVSPEVPAWGDQGITAVTRPHRGHRLGLLTKATMLEWLAEAEPALARITTENAESNSYMISVNEALGYRLAPPGLQFVQAPVGDIRQ